MSKPTKEQLEQFRKDCITSEGYAFCNLESARRNNIIPLMFEPDDFKPGMKLYGAARLGRKRSRKYGPKT